MGCCPSCPCYNRDISAVNTPRVFVGVSEEFQLNKILKRWRSGEVTLLQRKFRDARGTARGLSRDDLVALFQLQEYEVLLGDGMMKLFDTRRRGEVDFKDFCRCLALCCRGTRAERLRFVFDLFSGANQPKNLGYQPTAQEALEEEEADQKEDSEKADHSTSAMALDLREGQQPVLSHDAAVALAEYCKVDMRATQFAATGISLKSYFETAQRWLPDEKVEIGLAPFYLLPSPQMEKQGFMNAVKDFKYEDGTQLFLVSYIWWVQWVRYVGLTAKEEMDLLHLDDLSSGRTPRTSVGSPLSDSQSNTEFCLSINSPERSQNYCTTNGESRNLSSFSADISTTSRPKVESMKIASLRPDEINNTDIQALAVWELKEDIQLGMDFVVWPKAGWAIMSDWYGGGPTFSRKVLLSANEKQLELDLYPVALSVNSCDVVGKPGLIEKLVLVSKRDLLGKAAADICQTWRLTLGEEEKRPSSKKGTVDDLEREDEDEEELPPLADLATIEKHVRAWTFDLDRTQALREEEEEGEENSNEENHDTAPSSTAQRQQNAVSVQSVGRWEVLSTGEFKKSMEALEFRSGQRLMIEIRLPNGEWPRDRYIEPPDFRDFSTGDRVDAMDYRGRWYTGAVVTVERGSSKERSSKGGSKSISAHTKRVRVHFDRFASKWDEWYDVNSSRLAPEASYTAVAPQPVESTEEDEAGEDTSSRSGKKKTPRNMLKKLPSIGGSGGSTGSMKRNTQNQQPSEGINNYNNVSINRRSHTMGQPPIPGACGLVNMGNTCFLNSALQCLSHTPLLRAYLLSGLFEPEINTNNPLGTKGQLLEDFAGLLSMLWSDEYLCVLPSKFRRTLSKHKQQFSGNEQQDSQEFLAEMLDALHEDVNRVREKPYVAALEDHETKGKSHKQLARMFWDRHLMRNRSVIVDLFQGQLKVEVTCPECNKHSVNFDPFMYLSVPIPAQLEKAVEVTLIRRVRQGMKKESLMPMRFGLLLPRLGEISDLKKSLADLCNIPKEKFIVTDVYRHKFHRVFEDSEPLALIRDDDVIVAYEKTRYIPDSKDEGTTPKSSGSRTNRSTRSNNSNNKKNIFSSDTESESSQKKVIVEDEDSGTDYDEAHGKKLSEPSEFPETYSGFKKGLRLDAIDHRGHWYSGIVADVQKNRVRIHFDRFSSKWDEWYSEQDWAERRLRPLNTKVPYQHQNIEIHLVHRRPISSPGSKGSRSWGSPRTNHLKSIGKELFGVPLLINCDGEKSVAYFYQLVLQQITRFLKPNSEMGGNVLRGLVKKGGERLWSATSRLPFTICLASSHNPAGDLAATELTPDPNIPIISTVSNKMSVVVDWHDPSQYDPASTHWVDHSSYTELNSQSAQEARGEGVTLAACLNQFTKEETLDEGSWYCSQCRTHRRARTRTMLWSMPDILVISVKRFHCSARWREKIRTLVYFPQSGFDTSGWVAGDSEQGGKGSLVYDLYGVVNHVGGMTGGHYTAFCRSVPCTRDGVEEVGTGGSDGPWLHFDDEFVEEISPDKIVSEAAYVLFYKKRRITPSNVITMTV